MRRLILIYGVLFGICLLILLRTMVPTLYTLDSAEFAIAADTLGIPHAPGYSLYVIIAHGFAQLPIRDVSYRVNLLSAISLAGTAPFLYGLLHHLTGNRIAAASAALICMWSYYVWATGIVAEVYAPQLVTLALFGWVLVAHLTRETFPPRAALDIGVTFGVAVAMHPSSILFAPGVIAAFRLRKVTWRASILAAAISFLVFAGSLVYFPLRFRAAPVLNLAGTYDASGVFQPVNLQSLHGIFWLLSGQQFHDLFFASGNGVTRVMRVIELFWANYLGVGVLLGLIGGIVLFRKRRAWGWLWTIFMLPYTVFYASYGASDFEAMLGPLYVLWAILIAFGLQWVFTLFAARRVQTSIAVVFPLIFLLVNFPLLDLSNDTQIRTRTEATLNEIPTRAIVFGHWWDIVPLQYLHLVEDQRPDLTLRNLFLFDEDTFEAYWTTLLSQPDTTVVVVGTNPSVVPTNVPVSMTTMTIETHSGEAIIVGMIFTGDQ